MITYLAYKTSKFIVFCLSFFLLGLIVTFPVMASLEAEDKYHLDNYNITAPLKPPIKTPVDINGDRLKFNREYHVTATIRGVNYGDLRAELSRGNYDYIRAGGSSGMATTVQILPFDKVTNNTNTVNAGDFIYLKATSSHHQDYNYFAVDAMNYVFLGRNNRADSFIISGYNSARPTTNYIYLPNRSGSIVVPLGVSKNRWVEVYYLLTYDRKAQFIFTPA